MYRYVIFLLLLSSIAPAQYRWRLSPLPLFNEVTELAFDSEDNLYAITYGRGLWESLDLGKSWNPSTLIEREINTVYISPSDNIFIAGYYGTGIYFSSDDGNMWVQRGLTDHIVNSLDISDSQIMYAAADDSGVLRSFDFGASWEKTPFRKENDKCVLVGQNNKVFTIADGKLYCSNDDGVSWQRVIGQLGDDYIGSIDTDSDGVLYAGTYEYVPRDSGWSKGRVAVSHDNGETWTKHLISPQLLDVSVSSVANVEGVGLLATTYAYGVWRSVDGGVTWEPFINGLRRTRVLCSAVSASGEIAIGLSGGDVYFLESEETDIDNPPAPTSLALSQSYPNPVGLHAQSAVIEYDLPRGGYVSLSVYDLSGRLVQTLVDAHQSPGKHSAVFTPGHLPAGLYIYRLSAEGQTITKKLSVVR